MRVLGSNYEVLEALGLNYKEGEIKSRELQLWRNHHLPHRATSINITVLFNQLNQRFSFSCNHSNRQQNFPKTLARIHMTGNKRKQQKCKTAMHQKFSKYEERDWPA